MIWNTWIKLVADFYLIIICSQLLVCISMQSCLLLLMFCGLCMHVCRSQLWAQQKWMCRSRCPSGYGLRWAQGTAGYPQPQEKGKFEGNLDLILNLIEFGGGESPSPLQSIGNIWHMVDILNLICYVTAETLSVLQHFVVVVTSACCHVSASTLQSVTVYIMRTHHPTVCSQGRVLFTTWLPASTSLTAASVQTSASLTLPTPPRSVDRYLCYSALDYLCFLLFGMLTGWLHLCLSSMPCRDDRYLW